MKKDELLTPKEVAGILKVPISWVYERTRTRDLPIKKIGRHVRVRMSDLEQWIDRETPYESEK